MMKAETGQVKLKTALALCARTAQSGRVLPVLSHVLLETTDEGRLRLTATNMAVSVEITLDAMVEEAGALTVPAALFRELVAGMEPERAALSAPEDKPTLTVVCGGRHVTIQGFTADTMPPVPEPENAREIIFREGVLPGALKFATMGAATDGTRPVLEGVSVRSTGDALTLGGANGFVVAVATLDVPGSDGLDIILPPGLLPLIATMDGEIRMAVDERLAVFECEQMRVTALLLRGTFPNFMHFTATDDISRFLEMDRAGFLDAVNAAVPVARDGSGMLRLQESEGGLVLSCSAPNIADFETMIDCGASMPEGDVTPFRVTLNVQYLKEMLSAMNTPKVKMGGLGPSSPVLFSEPGRQCVVMPMFKA